MRRSLGLHGIPIVGPEVDVAPVLDRARFGKAAPTKNHDPKLLTRGR